MERAVNYRKPYILKGIYTGLMVFLLLSALFILLYRHSIPLLFYLLATGFVNGIFFANRVIYFLAKKQTFGYLNQFYAIPELGAYSEAMDAVYTPKKKYPHFVLLLHGFTASPHEMQHLMHELEKQGIPYFAPMQTGFGLTDFHLLKAVRHQDFFRKALFYYDFLSQIAENVSVVAHSMGAVLATYIAERRQVHHLILTAPALHFFPEDKKLIQLLSAPIICDLIIKIVPCLPKTVKKTTSPELVKTKIANTRFQYLSVPTHAIKHMLLAKKMVNITHIKNTTLHVIYGDNDTVVNINACLSAMKENHIPHTIHCIPNTGHNLFEESSKQEVSDIVIKLLKKQEC